MAKLTIEIRLGQLERTVHLIVERLLAENKDLREILERAIGPAAVPERPRLHVIKGGES